MPSAALTSSVGTRAAALAPCALVRPQRFDFFRAADGFFGAGGCCWGPTSLSSLMRLGSRSSSLSARAIAESSWGLPYTCRHSGLLRETAPRHPREVGAAESAFSWGGRQRTSRWPARREEKLVIGRTKQKGKIRANGQHVYCRVFLPWKGSEKPISSLLESKCLVSSRSCSAGQTVPGAGARDCRVDLSDRI